MRKLALALITTSLTTGCLFTETGNNPQNTQDDSIVEQDMPTEPGPADMDDMGVVEGDMSPPAPDMRMEPSDLGSPDMDPPPSDMGCQPRRLETCTAYERLSEARVEDGCDAMLDCSMAYVYIPQDVTTVGQANGIAQLTLAFDPAYVPAPGAGPSDAACGPEGMPRYRMEPLREGELPHFELGQGQGGATIRPINPHANDESEEIFLSCITPGGELPEVPLHIAVRLPDVPGNIGPNRTPRLWLRADNYTPDVRLWQGEGEAGVRMLPVHVQDEVEDHTSPSTDPNLVYGNANPFPAIRFNSFSDFGNDHYHGMRASQSVTDFTPAPVRLGTTQTIIIVARRNPNNGSTNPDGSPVRDVLLRDGIGNNQVRFSTTGANALVYQFVPQDENRMIASGLVPQTPGSSMHVYTMIRDGANVRFFQDYEELLGVSPIDGNSEFVFRDLAGQFAEDSGAESFRGEIGEVMIYESALPDGDVRRLVTYLVRKYALMNVQQP
jgi:hypothetical protein